MGRVSSTLYFRVHKQLKPSSFAHVCYFEYKMGTRKHYRNIKKNVTIRCPQVQIMNVTNVCSNGFAKEKPVNTLSY